MNGHAKPRQSDSRAARQARASAPIRPIAISYSLEVMKDCRAWSLISSPTRYQLLEVGDVLRFIASRNCVRA
jgi:hypothetical protein